MTVHTVVRKPSRPPTLHISNRKFHIAL